MSVYVDDARTPYGRMKMSHLVADTTAELLAMADAIGLNRRWIQRPGTAAEHFDVCLALRRRAIAFGAIAVTQRDIARIVRAKRS